MRRSTAVIAALLWAAAMRGPLRAQDGASGQAQAQAQTQAQAQVQVDGGSFAGGRQLEDQTRRAVIRDYLSAWKSLAEAFDRNQPGLLDADFVGTQRDRLAETVRQQAAAGVHVRYQPTAHRIHLLLYSPEGMSIELADDVDYEMRVFSQRRLIRTVPESARYIVILTPAELRWQVRLLQATSGQAASE